MKKQTYEKVKEMISKLPKSDYENLISINTYDYYDGSFNITLEFSEGDKK